MSMTTALFFALCELRYNQVAVDEFRSGLLNHSARDKIFLLPKGRHLYLPWKMIRHQEDGDVHKNLVLPLSAANAKMSGEENDKKYSLGSAVAIADILLMPSPGEQFWLKIDCSDIWLNTDAADLSIEVRSFSLSKSRWMHVVSAGICWCSFSSFWDIFYSINWSCTILSQKWIEINLFE